MTPSWIAPPGFEGVTTISGASAHGRRWSARLIVVMRRSPSFPWDVRVFVHRSQIDAVRALRWYTEQVTPEFDLMEEASGLLDLGVGLDDALALVIYGGGPEAYHALRNAVTARNRSTCSPRT